MPAEHRILILTAAFGEGHNSAARNLALAFNHLGIESHVSDPCLLGTPQSTKALQWAYRIVTTHFPKIWEKIYRGTDKCDFKKQRLPLMRKAEAYLQNLIESYQPTAIVSTFPIYPYFIERIEQENGTKLPIFTVVTDSIEINASWLRAPTDYWLVTDQLTRQSMHQWGIPQEKIIDTGFPVHPAFTTLAPLPENHPIDPFRILYFPTAKLPHVRRHSRAILDASPHIHLTIILGKNLRRLYSRAKEIKTAYPGRVTIKGWTKKVPQLLNQHHLVIGKAGGATTHEAIAARCPMLIHHIVPGQEEGNLQLLQHLNVGNLANTPETLSASISNILANNATLWKSMKKNLATHNRNNGSQTAAAFILKDIEDRE